MKSIVAALAALAVATVSAQQGIVSVTAPLSGTVYHAGQDAIITWYILFSSFYYFFLIPPLLQYIYN